MKTQIVAVALVFAAVYSVQAECDCNAVLTNGMQKLEINSQKDLEKYSRDKLSKELDAQAGHDGKVGYGELSIKGSWDKARKEKIAKEGVKSLSDHERNAFYAESLGQGVLEAWLKCLELCTIRSGLYYELLYSGSNSIVNLVWRKPYPGLADELAVKNIRAVNVFEVGDALKQGMKLSQNGTRVMLQRTNFHEPALLVLETETARELAVRLDPLPQPPPVRTNLGIVKLKVRTKTGTLKNSRTDDYVLLWVAGKNGKAGPFTLNSPRNDFEPGKVDSFGPFDLPDFGPIDSIQFTIQPASKNKKINDWYVEWVEVSLSNEEKPHQKILQLWLGDDNATSTISSEL